MSIKIGDVLLPVKHGGEYVLSAKSDVFPGLSPVLADAQLARGHGVAIPSSPAFLGPGKIAVEVHCYARSGSGVRPVAERLTSAAFNRGRPVAITVQEPGIEERQIQARLESQSWDGKTKHFGVLKLSFDVPFPVWEGTALVKGVVDLSSGAVNGLAGLAGSTGPVRFRFTGQLSARCRVSSPVWGWTVNTGGPIDLAGYQSENAKVRVDMWADPFLEDIPARLVVSGAGPGDFLKWEARKAWL